MKKFTAEELVAIYNPSNAKSLTLEQIAYMKEFTAEEIAILANAYPNQSRGNSYLVLYNKSVDANKQTFQLSTFHNLKSLWNLGKKEFVIYTFKVLFTNPSATKAPATATAPKVAAKVVDLTEKDLNDAVGLKKVDLTNEDLNDAGSKEVSDDSEAPELASLKNLLAAAENDHAALIEAKAHHMTIKSKLADIDDLKEKIANFSA